MSKKATEPRNNEEKIYEIGYHLISSIAEEQIPAEVEKIKAYLTKENAIILSEETPKLRPLAYSIKKSFEGTYKTFDKAYFGFIKFELPEAGDIKIIDSALKNNLNVLRYLVIKTVRENTMYSPKMTVFSDKEVKARPIAEKTELKKEVETSASAEEIDASIDALVSDPEEVVVA
jgi:ribosomal protein S6